VVVGIAVVGVHLGGGDVIVRLGRLRAAEGNGSRNRSDTREGLTGANELAGATKVLLVLGRVGRVQRAGRGHAVGVVKGVLSILLLVVVTPLAVVLGRSVRAAVGVVCHRNGSGVRVRAATDASDEQI
jgi:hypothetical protein